MLVCFPAFSSCQILCSPGGVTRASLLLQLMSLYRKCRTASAAYFHLVNSAVIDARLKPTSYILYLLGVDLALNLLELPGQQALPQVQLPRHIC